MLRMERSHPAKQPSPAVPERGTSWVTQSAEPLPRGVGGAGFRPLPWVMRRRPRIERSAGRRRRPAGPAPGILSQSDPRSCLARNRGWLVRRPAEQSGEARAQVIQRGAVGSRSAVCRCARRSLHGAGAGHQRLRTVAGQGGPDRVRGDGRWRRPGGSTSGRIGGAAAGRQSSLPTAWKHSRHRAQNLAEIPGAPHQPSRRRRCVGRASRKRPDARHFQAGRNRGGMAARALGDPARARSGRKGARR